MPNKEQHNHIIPLVGGPLCGDSITLKGLSIPNSVPMFYQKKFYTYVLCIEYKNDWTDVYYKHNNEINTINTKLEETE